MNPFTAKSPDLDGEYVVDGYSAASKPSLSSKHRLLPKVSVHECVGCGREAFAGDDGDAIAVIDGAVTAEVIEALRSLGVTVRWMAKPVIEVGRTGNDLGIVLRDAEGKVVNPYTTACLPECKRCNGSGAREAVIDRLRSAYLAAIRRVGRRL